MTNDRDDLQRQLDEAEKKLTTLDETNKTTLQTQTDAANTTLASMTQARDDALTALDKAKEALSTAITDHDETLRAQSDAATSQLSRWKKERDTMQREIDQGKTELARVNKLVSDAELNASAMEKTRVELKTKLEEIAKKMDDTTQSYEEALATANKRAESAAKELTASGDTNSTLEAQVKQFREDTKKSKQLHE